MRAIHPIIRIAGFLVLAAFLSFGSLNILLIAAALLVVLYLIAGASHLSPALKMLRRMRWLFLSLAIVYFWFTPGEPLLFSASSWAPTREGLEEGVIRIASLIAIVLAVNLLLQTTSRDQLLSAVHWLAGPLRVIGIPRDRLALRMTLVFDAVPKVQALVAPSSAADVPLPGKVARIGNTMSSLYQRVLTHAEGEGCHTIEIAMHGRPPFLQWLYPLSLAVALWLGSISFG
ncbi:MAG: hypothetical protein IDH49_01755 [Gammaproteobacteria bacterium]|nr:hypothetical protein [Gammaproteobacteria bacterium]